MTLPTHQNRVSHAQILLGGPKIDTSAHSVVPDAKELFRKFGLISAPGQVQINPARIVQEFVLRNDKSLVGKKSDLRVDADLSAGLVGAKLERIYALATANELDEATDLIFETIDRLQSQTRYDECDRMLQCAEVGRLPSFLQRSFLAITFSARDQLPHRDGFYQRAFESVQRNQGYEKAERIFASLK